MLVADFVDGAAVTVAEDIEFFDVGERDVDGGGGGGGEREDVAVVGGLW